MKNRAILIMIPVVVILGIIYLRSSETELEVIPPPRPFVWDIAIDQLKAITISLPNRGVTQSWILREDMRWYFDEPEGFRVDMDRWGGVPLLLSGPGSNSLVTENVTDEQMETYGLNEPSMLIQIGKKDLGDLQIIIGNPTITGQSYYIHPKGTGRVFSVDHTWYEVLEQMVLDPPKQAQDSR